MDEKLYKISDAVKQAIEYGNDQLWSGVYSLRTGYSGYSIDSYRETNKGYSDSSIMLDCSKYGARTVLTWL